MAEMGLVMMDYCLNFSSFSKSHEGRVRSYNEDAFFCSDANGVWVVADGMGGHEAGDYASKLLVELIEHHLSKVNEEDVDTVLLRNIVTEANYKIKQYSINELNGEVVGTTVAILLIQNGRYYCLWAGDSRIYLYRNNQLVQKTRDHSQIMDMVDQGILTEESAEQHPMANVITRAVGVENEIDIDEVSDILCDGDKFLLCSDGLTKELNYHHISDCLRASEVNDSVLALMHSALVRGASDNVTCVMVKVSEQVQQTKLETTVPIFKKKR
ncbi:PP2C family protein-serine/threonine phosphatase [Photobacterium sp. TY1-4]|uniref:PP2C family protein-serine/threonine phosphatase n=1 Tax=Photobacterium sp. TY1-4 TaxID=2899122 RepID=UPI0021C150B8|nr:protein phosphatase 2C domain-containing protein [Photobacterium sp. TY1-4]UXI02684.1 protein phosphatase 2C domain-containing protein [Photobacterium sp. TY1-4]